MSTDTVLLLEFPCKRSAIPTRCQHCGSGLIEVETRTAGLDLAGEMVCRMCSRPVAHLIQRRPRIALTPVDLAPRRGRPTKAELARRAIEAPCRVCRQRPARPNRRKCRACMDRKRVVS